MMIYDSMTVKVNLFFNFFIIYSSLTLIICVAQPLPRTCGKRQPKKCDNGFPARNRRCPLQVRFNSLRDHINGCPEKLFNLHKRLLNQ